MNHKITFSSLMLAGVAALAAVQPAQANSNQVTNVRTNQSNSGLEVVLETRGDDRPEVFALSRNNNWVADIVNTTLNIPQGGFQQANPAPGIASVQVMPLDGNSVRVIVTGDGTAAPRGAVASRSANGLVFKVQAAAAPVAVQVPAQTAPASPINTLPINPSPNSSPIGTSPTLQTFAAQSPVTSQPSPLAASSNFASPSVQPPSLPPTQAQPSIRPSNFSSSSSSTIAQAQPGTTSTPTRQGDPATISPNPTPPTLPRAVPPPLGDVTFSTLDPSPSPVDLGSRERIPRLVLRNAPAREVLSLLARAAGTNLAYVDVTADATGQPGAAAPATPAPGQPGVDTTAGPRVTLDIENESVQDVFNHVLRLTGLQANKIGTTIYVGVRLPVGARDLVSRTIRLNQALATDAAAYLAAFGAETTITVPSQPEIVTQTIQGVTGAPPITQQVTRQSTPSIQTLTNRSTDTNVSLVLRGVQVTPDQRLNSVTLVGSPYQVELATGYLKQLDLRRRQVAVNVKIIDVDLNSSPFSNSSFSFGLGDSFLSVDGGVIGVNFGRTAPNASTSPPRLTSASSPVSGFFPGNTASASGFSGFLARLTQAVTTNNAKILTDPTLIIQEGQTSSVNLVEQIVTDTTQTVSQGETSTQITTTNILKDVGLQLTIVIERIDDNGFVTLNVSPRVSAPSGTQDTATGTFPIVGTRELSSGAIRLRDGQTLVLAGIIREEERQSVRKVPILGDLPIIGALFRSVDSTSSRNEVIVVLTTNILDDTLPNSNVNYGYTPSRESQEILQRGGYR